MASSAVAGALRSRAIAVGTALSVLAFTLHFVLVVSADLFPIEQMGAEFKTTDSGARVTTVRSDTPAARAGLVSGDEVLSLDGLPRRNALDWASLFAGIEPGQPIEAIVRRDGVTRAVDLTFRRRSGVPWSNASGGLNLFARAIQLVTLAFAVLIVGRGRTATTLPGAWLLATIGIYSVGLPPGMAVAWRRLPAVLQLLLYFPSISKVLIGPILFVFFRALLGLPLTGAVRLLVVGPSAVIAAWDATFITALLSRSPRLGTLTEALAPIIAVNFLYVAAMLTMLTRRYSTVQSAAERRRLRWVTTGTLLGCVAGAPIIAGLWLGVNDDPTVIYHTPLALQGGYMLFLLMPMSLWIATAKGELFDLEFVVRRGLQYAFARRAVLATTPAAVALILVDAARHRSLSIAEVVSSHALFYVLIAAAAVTFATQRGRLLTWLDRRLFRERYNASQLLRDMALTARTTRDLEMAAEFAVSRIEAALHPDFIAVYAPSDEGEPTLLAASGQLRDSLSADAVDRAVRSLRHPIDLASKGGAWGTSGCHADVAALRRFGARLVIPLAERSSGAEGCLVLGGKRSDEPYSQEDRVLLQAVAESLGELLDERRSPSPPTPRDEESSVTPDQRLWMLAGAVAGGEPVDWAAETAGVREDASRQVLLELEALERLMHVHGEVGRPEAPHPIDDGMRRWGPFELRARLGAGRFGTVHRGWDPRLEREVAIKLLDSAAVDRAAYLREARHLARVHHTNVVSVYGADEHDGVPGFWMELVAGETLAASVKQHGPLDFQQTRAVADAIGRALTAIHGAGIVHQDVKAENVMREPGGRLVLMDLGASTSGTDQPRYGTPAYMAPEVLRGGAASESTDVYSLGVLLFFLLCGTFPSGVSGEADAPRPGDIANQLRALHPEIPEPLAQAIDRAVRIDPIARFSTAEEFRLAIDAGPDGAPHLT